MNRERIQDKCYSQHNSRQYPPLRTVLQTLPPSHLTLFSLVHHKQKIIHPHLEEADIKPIGDRREGFKKINVSICLNHTSKHEPNDDSYPAVERSGPQTSRLSGRRDPRPLVPAAV